MDGIDAVKDKQEEMADDIAKIKEAVYNPDEGLYARIRLLELTQNSNDVARKQLEDLVNPEIGIYSRIKEIEKWKENQSRLIWIIITAVAGLSVAAAWSTIVAA